MYSRYLTVLVTLCIVAQIQSGPVDSSNRKVILSINDKGTTNQQYYLSNYVSNIYHFGYGIDKTGNFHHEIRDENGVTFGCYGELTDKNELRATHYVADKHGYRIVKPDKPITIFLVASYEESGGNSFTMENFPLDCGKSAQELRANVDKSGTEHVPQPTKLGTNNIPAKNEPHFVKPYVNQPNHIIPNNKNNNIPYDKDIYSGSDTLIDPIRLDPYSDDNNPIPESTHENPTYVPDDSIYETPHQNIYENTPDDTNYETPVNEPENPTYPQITDDPSGDGYHYSKGYSQEY